MFRTVKTVTPDVIFFNDGTTLSSDHSQDCCESHYLDFSDLEIGDFDGLEFDLSNEKFFKRIDGYGIELVPKHGHSIKVPGYGINNGYYSSNLDLIVYFQDREADSYDITDCQDWD